MNNENIIPHEHKIKREHRHNLNGHKSLLVWFTGLSGSGKSSIAGRVEEKLFEKGFKTYILDADNVRMGLNKGLGFLDEDRFENMRRVAEVSKLFLDSGTIVLATFISPKERERENVKEIVGKENYVETFVDCPFEVCEKRDVKGLYKKAKEGKISNFIGLHTSFEKPINPDLIVNSDKMSVEECADKIIEYILPRIEI